MSWTDEIKLRLLEPKTKYYWDSESNEIENIRVFLPECGHGAIHELIELDLIRVVAKLCPEIPKTTDYHYCKSLFHALTERIQENFADIPT